MDIYFYIFIDRCKPETSDVSLFEFKYCCVSYIKNLIKMISQI